MFVLSVLEAPNTEANSVCGFTKILCNNALSDSDYQSFSDSDDTFPQFLHFK